MRTKFRLHTITPVTIIALAVLSAITLWTMTPFAVALVLTIR